MYSYQNRCTGWTGCSGCGCNSGCGLSARSGGSSGSSGSGREYTCCYCSRYVDVPMCIYYGEGYTSQNSLQAISQSLSQIANTLCTMQG